MAESTKVELAASLEKARARMARNAEALRHDLDVATHLRHSFHENKAAYIGGATIFGLLLSKLPSRKKKVYAKAKAKEGIKDAEKAGFWLILLQFAFKALQPTLTSLVKSRVTEYVKSRGQGREQS
ncbi:MAG: hypothetical protein ABSE62_01330 [Chthoniobacteraceae bacterium]|jgi:hypothetical protein